MPSSTTPVFSTVPRSCRLRPQLLVNAVDPGWVPTKGPSASDDLELGHLTQVWLASDEPAAQRSGQYWFHQRIEQPHPAVRDESIQGSVLAALAAHTQIELPQE